MINHTSRIVWLVYQSGMGGDQLYWLLNNTGNFAWYHNAWSRLTNSGKRLTEDLFNFRFQCNDLQGRFIKDISHPQDLLHIANQCVHEPDRVHDWNRDVLIKMHYYCDQQHLQSIAPGSKTIYLMSDSKNYRGYLQKAQVKNQEFSWFPDEYSDEAFRGFEQSCMDMEKKFSTAHAIDADRFFQNDNTVWESLIDYLDLQCSVDEMWQKHSDWTVKQTKVMDLR